jgi:hypothetical protein
MRRTVADASAPFGGSALAAILPLLWEGVDRGQRSCVRTVTAVLRLCPAEVAANGFRRIVRIAVHEKFSVMIAGERAVRLQIFQYVLERELFNTVLLGDIGRILFTHGWSSKNIAEGKVVGRVIDVTVELARHSSAAAVLRELFELFRQSLLHFWGIIQGFLCDKHPEVLAAVLDAIRAIADVIEPPELQPPPDEIVGRLLPILKNRNSKIESSCLRLVVSLSEKTPEIIQNEARPEIADNR